MSGLNDKLLEIKRQKDTYILPENIREGVTIFGVTGTYTGQQDSVVEYILNEIMSATAMENYYKTQTLNINVNANGNSSLTDDEISFLLTDNFANYHMDLVDTNNANIGFYGNIRSDGKYLLMLQPEYYPTPSTMDWEVYYDVNNKIWKAIIDENDYNYTDNKTEIDEMFATYNDMCTHLSLSASMYCGQSGFDFTDETVVNKVRMIITILVKMYGVSLAN